MGSGFSRQSLTEPTSAQQLPDDSLSNTKATHSHSLHIPALQAGNMIGQVKASMPHSSKSSGTTGAARLPAKPAENAASNKQSKAQVAARHASAIRERTSLGLQLQGSAPKPSSSFQLNFASKPSASLFAKSSFALKPAKAPAIVSHAAGPGGQLLSAFRWTSGGTAASTGPPVLPFNTGSIPAQSSSMASGTLATHSAVTAQATHGRPETEDRPTLTAAASKPMRQPAIIPQQDTVPAVQPSSTSRTQNVTPGSVPDHDLVSTKTPLPAAKSRSPASPHTVTRDAAEHVQETNVHERANGSSVTPGRAAGQEENADPARQPWTATSLAGDLIHNMKHLEAVRKTVLLIFSGSCITP